MENTTTQNGEEMPLKLLNELDNDALKASRNLLKGETIEITFAGENATLSYNDDGENSFYLRTAEFTIYFIDVERCGDRAYFLKQNGAISATIEFSDEEEIQFFEQILRFLAS